MRRAVSMQRHQGDEITLPRLAPFARQSAPSFAACARPSGERLRCVAQSSSRAPGGSGLGPGALACRMIATAPSPASAAQAASASCDHAGDRAANAAAIRVARHMRRRIDCAEGGMTTIAAASGKRIVAAIRGISKAARCA
jgi:hypothetical protein